MRSAFVSLQAGPLKSKIKRFAEDIVKLFKPENNGNHTIEEFAQNLEMTTVEVREQASTIEANTNDSKAWENFSILKPLFSRIFLNHLTVVTTDGSEWHVNNQIDKRSTAMGTSRVVILQGAQENVCFGTKAEITVENGVRQAKQQRKDAKQKDKERKEAKTASKQQNDTKVGTKRLHPKNKADVEDSDPATTSSVRKSNRRNSTGTPHQDNCKACGQNIFPDQSFLTCSKCHGQFHHTSTCLAKVPTNTSSYRCFYCAP